MPKVWFLLPLCLLIGVSSSYFLVKYSQSYLSEGLGQNSKQELIGKIVDLNSIAEHLGDERIISFIKDNPEGKIWLSFWSMECAPCLEKLKQIKTTEKQLIVAINTDPPEQLEVAQQTFQVLAPKELPYLHDGLRVLTKNFEVEFLPTHILVNSKGKVKDYQIGKDAPLR